MLYSALITTIAIDSHADPESRYTTKIKQKFLDAVVGLSPTASIDNIEELVKSSSHTVAVGAIALPDDFVKLISIKSASTASTLYTFIEVTAEMWGRLGSDIELDPNQYHCFYFVDGRNIRFYLSTTGNINSENDNISIKYIAYPEQWGDNDEMYEKYSSIFIEACRIEAVKEMKILLRGEQNDVE